MVQTVPCAAEAVNSPEVALMPPQEDDQVAAIFALNCCVCPPGVMVLEGVMVSGEVTVATVDASVPPEDVAVTVQDAKNRGAVNSPVALMLPQEAAKVALPLAVNCCVAPSLTVGLGGEIANEEATETTSYP
jgi:hypothetical protein